MKKAYFFTNEKLASFLATDHFAKIDRVFGIGGGGDFAFNLLTLHSPTKIILCDDLPLAISTIHEKTERVRHSSREAFLRFLTSKEFKQTKKSRCYYPDGFQALTRIDDFLPYLSSRERYLCLQKTLSKIEVIAGDFSTELSTQSEPFDLIYLSNLFETKHCDPTAVLAVCRSRLTDNGKILFASQDSPKTVDRLLKKNLFRHDASEIHAFSTLSAIMGHYSYSFYLYRPMRGPTESTSKKSAEVFGQMF